MPESTNGPDRVGHPCSVTAERVWVEARSEGGAGPRRPCDAELESRLRSALEADRVTLAYQPVVDLSTGVVVAAEALARWHDDELGDVPPDLFIPVAEHTGLIVDLGRSVLRRACQEAAGWAQPAEGSRPVVVSVNVSPLQLRESSFVRDVQNALADAGLPASLLCLEVTETAIVTDVDAAASTMWALRELGVQFALDDFGTGHSSLTLLRRLPLQLVKIDRSLIRRVALVASEAILVQLIVDAAHTLGMRVCAEGIEEPGQAQQLVALGGDSGQGWLFSRPGEPPAAGSAWSTPLAPATWLQPSVAAPVPLRGSDDLVVVADRLGIVTYVSASYRRLLGGPPMAPVGHPLRELLGVDVDEGPVTLEVLHHDGSTRWLRGVVQPMRGGAGVQEVLCVLTDITAEVAQDRALADSEELFRRAFSGAPIGIALSDFDGRLLRVNAALADMLGQSVDDLLLLTVGDITHPEDRHTDEINLDEARSGAVTGHRVRKRYVRADGTAVPVEVHAATVHTADGEPYCIVAHVLPEQLAGRR